MRRLFPSNPENRNPPTAPPRSPPDRSRTSLPSAASRSNQRPLPSHNRSALRRARRGICPQPGRDRPRRHRHPTTPHRLRRTDHPGSLLRRPGHPRTNRSSTRARRTAAHAVRALPLLGAATLGNTARFLPRPAPDPGGRIHQRAPNKASTRPRTAYPERRDRARGRATRPATRELHLPNRQLTALQVRDVSRDRVTEAFVRVLT